MKCLEGACKTSVIMGFIYSYMGYKHLSLMSFSIMRESAGSGNNRGLTVCNLTLAEGGTVLVSKGVRVWVAC